MNIKYNVLILSIVCFLGMAADAVLTIDWTNTDATEIGTAFTLNIATDGSGIYRVASTENVPAAMTFTASGATGLPGMTNKTFALTFSSVNGQNFESHSSAGAYRIGLEGGLNIWRFDETNEIARMTADLSQMDSIVNFRLKSFEDLNDTSDYVIGLRDSSGVETLGETNQTDLASIAPLLSGGDVDFFDFRAETGCAGGWGELEFEFLLAPGVEAIRPAGIFSSGCVLQRGRTVPVWGTCAPNDSLTLQMNGQTKSAVADANGKWRVELDAESAGGPYVMSIEGTNSLSAVLKDVYFGDVWILTGQSNMYQPLGSQVAAFPNDYPAVPDATDDFDDVRFAIVDTVSADSAPADDVTMDQTWTRWQADRLADMSAVGYFFAKALNTGLDANGMQNVPLGIIKVCKGGTAVEEWIADGKLDEALAADPSLVIAPEASGYYNGMIAPIQDYPVKGALWYQGESNTTSIDRIRQYPTLQQVLIESWREQWGNPELPFYYVQLAPHHAYAETPRDEAWAWMRESQASCLSITNTGMTCIIDGGLQGDVHPPFKDRAGQRLARIALADTYEIPQIARGPNFTGCQFNGADATLIFDSVAGGLRTQAVDSQPDEDEIAEGFPAVSVSSNELAGFALCGSDQMFYWATEAEIISSNQVRISNSMDVPVPVAVRYAWQNYPRCNLFNTEGLPAEPFRTDSYEYLSSSVRTDPEFTVVYQDDFSGTATADATDTVPEVSQAGFSDVAVSTGLDGSGRLESTSPTSTSANYRFQIAESPLTADSSVGAIKYTVRLRTPTNDWVLIGFQESSVNGLTVADANTGPMVLFRPGGRLIFYDGTWGGNLLVLNDNYEIGEVVTAEMTYHIVSRKMDLSINGTVVANDVAVEHEFPIGTNSNPVVCWAQVQFRKQPSVADGGAYVDRFMIETSPTGEGVSIYQDEFSGEADVATTTVPEIAPLGFEQNDSSMGLDGSGRLESTDSGQTDAGYRVRLGQNPLTADPSISALRLIVKMRVPTNDWVLIGFQEQDANGLFVEARNAGPRIQFNPTDLLLRGGAGGGGNVSEIIRNLYVPGQVISAEMTYHIAEQTVDLSINGSLAKEGFELGHEYPAGTNSDPVVSWFNCQFRKQPSAAAGGPYIDSLEVWTAPSPYVRWAFLRGPQIGAETEDYDNDGLFNLYEYGLGGDPADPSDQGVSPVLQFVNDGDSNRLVYVHPRLSAEQNSGKRYYLETRTNLVHGAWSNSGYIVTGTNVTGDALDYVTNETDTAESSKFIRLIIE